VTLVTSERKAMIKDFAGLRWRGFVIRAESSAEIRPIRFICVLLIIE